MPELAEVEFYRRVWDPGLGCRLTAVDIHPSARVFRGADPHALVQNLAGTTLLRSLSHGKQMLFACSKGHWLGLHLGMTGELRLEAPDFLAGRHDHLVLRQRSRSLVFADPRQFGRVRFHRGPTPPPWWPDASTSLLAPGFTTESLTATLQRHARLPIKALLLRQDRFPGIGNWMADEILWRARIHPESRAATLVDQAPTLWRQVRWVCAQALRLVAPTFADPPASWLFRHRWKVGGRCPRDQTPLERAEVGGRTTAWCARCQPLKRDRRSAQ